MFNKKANAPAIIILVLFVIISLGLSTFIFANLKKEQRKSASLNTELADVTDKLKAVEARYEDSKKMIKGLESKLGENFVQLDSLNKELEQEKASKEEIMMQVEQLKSDFEQQRTLRTELENKLMMAQDDMRKMQAQLSELSGKKAELETKVKELEEKSKGVELGTIVVNPENANVAVNAKEQVVDKKAAAKTAKEKPVKKQPRQAPLIEGKVLVVNKDYNFVVINLGSKDGIKIGDVFSLYHGDSLLTDVKVEKVHDAMAAAGIVSLNIKDQIVEGDKVIKKK